MKEMKKLGDFIQPVDVRNNDLSVTRLLGLSINKCFIESIANTIGTDFRPYKIVKKPAQTSKSSSLFWRISNNIVKAMMYICTSWLFAIWLMYLAACVCNI